MIPNDASSGSSPPPRSVCGGPFCGEILPEHHQRHWVVRLPGAQRESLLSGDNALGETLYRTQWEEPSRFVLTLVRGVYYRPRDARRSRVYLDLFVGTGSYAQRRYFDLADFMMLHWGLTRANDWLTRRPSAESATRVMLSWRQAPDVVRRVQEYPDWLIIDELDDG